MNTENYELLGVSESATDEEIKEAYERLKAKYNEEKWQDGEAGNAAARMLGKLDAAYREICDERKERAERTEGTSAYEDVADAIKKGDVSRAQQLLDNFNERGAEWHYLQSVVFYKKNWMNESKKQLEIAMQMDGGNKKYREAYEKLNARADYKQQTGGAPNVNPNPASGDEQMGGNWCSTCASMCYTYLCVNCLFNLCCSCR
ncbi:MAG: J domain-containing protein [Candidatus Gallimonas sp.]